MSDFDYRALDDLIHSRIRLAVMSILASVDDAEFTWLRDEVGTTDGNLGTHLGKLVDAGYLEAGKELAHGRAVTRYRMTEAGRRAFGAYVDHLEAMLGRGRDLGPTAAGGPGRETHPTEAS